MMRMIRENTIKLIQISLNFPKNVHHKYTNAGISNYKNTEYTLLK